MDTAPTPHSGHGAAPRVRNREHGHELGHALGRELGRVLGLSLACLLGAGLGLGAGSAAALELEASGFGNLGYAQTNRDYTWQRRITRDGTFARDSLLAAQLDATITPEWSATLQGKLAPARRNDDAWEATVTWAFVAWRPDNDWLLRAGRLRVPFFLHSETQDVGTTLDTVRAPNDIYWIAPTTDFNGLYATRNWQLGPREVSLDGYSGWVDTVYRTWVRDGVPGGLAAGARYTDLRVHASGLVLTLRDPRASVRLGVHRTSTRDRSGAPLRGSFPRVDLAPGLGYWQVSNELPGPGTVTAARIRNLLWTVGADWALPEGWRLTAEAARIEQSDTELGVDAQSAYVNVSRRIGAFTPYVTVSRLLSSRRQRDWVARLSSSDLPAALPGASLINAAQQAAGQSVTMYDQTSVGLGLSYSISTNVKLKTEWIRTYIGAGSSMANPPPGVAVPRETHVDVRSLMLSFDF